VLKLSLPICISSLLLFTGCCTIQRGSLDERLLQNNIDPKNYFIETTGSMTPTIMPGDRIYLDQTSFKNLTFRDVVLFRPNGVTKAFIDSTLCHRIIAKGLWKDSWITQGDANEYPDFPLLPENYLGRVAFIVHQNSTKLIIP